MTSILPAGTLVPREREVWAIGGGYERKEFDALGDAETGAAMVRFRNNAIGVFLAGRNCAYGYHIETEIIGTKGTIRIGTVPERNNIVLFNEKVRFRNV